MGMKYVAAMPLRKNLFINPDGKVPVVEHAFDSRILQTLCGDFKHKLEMLKHEWDPISPHTCRKCLRRYKTVSARK